MGITGMPNATTNNSLSKICNPKSVIRQPPLSKMWEIALPTPLRIDAPGCRPTVMKGRRAVHRQGSLAPSLRRLIVL